MLEIAAYTTATASGERSSRLVRTHVSNDQVEAEGAPEYAAPLTVLLRAIVEFVAATRLPHRAVATESRAIGNLGDGMQTSRFHPDRLEYAGAQTRAFKPTTANSSMVFAVADDAPKKLINNLLSLASNLQQS